MEYLMKFRKQTPTIDQLSDDILVLIFRHLSPLDLIKIELVCKRWYDVSLKTWPMRLDQSLNFRDLIISPSYTAKNIDRPVREIIDRCGEYVTEVTLSFRSNVDYNKCMVHFVDQKWPAVNWKLMRLSPDGIWALRKCKKLKRLNLDGIRNCPRDEYRDKFEYALMGVLGRLENLVELNIGHMETFTGECLSKLRSQRLETLRIFNCDNLDLTYLTFLGLTNSLKSLSLYRTKIYLSWDIDLPSSLTRLDLFFSSKPRMTNTMLIGIANKCRKLEEISLTLDDSVSRSALDTIFDLPLLQKIILNDDYDAHEVWGQRQRRMRNLKVVELCNYSLTDLDFIKLVEFSPRLEVLYVYAPKKWITIKREVLETLARTIGMRDNKINFQLRVSSWNPMLLVIDFDGNSYKIRKNITVLKNFMSVLCPLLTLLCFYLKKKALQS